MSHTTCVSALLDRKLRGVELRGWSVELNGEDGPSTGSGVRARQQLVLVPARMPGLRPFVIGSLCAVTSSAQLRSYEEIAAIHKARMGFPCSFTRADYVGFITDLAVAFACARIKLDVLRAAPAAERPLPRSPETNQRVGLAAIVAAVVVTFSTLWLAYVTPLMR